MEVMQFFIFWIVCIYIYINYRVNYFFSKFRLHVSTSTKNNDNIHFYIYLFIFFGGTQNCPSLSSSCASTLFQHLDVVADGVGGKNGCQPSGEESKKIGV